MFKCPLCPNVNDVVTWHLSRDVTLVTCGHTCHLWSHLSTTFTLSKSVTLVTCGHTCHMWSHLSHVVTLVICGHTSHMWSHLSHVVTIVTCGHICHMWSHLSNVVTIVTCGHTSHMWSNFSQETNVSTADQKVSSLSPKDDDDETRPTCRPARTQVKIPEILSQVSTFETSPIAMVIQSHSSFRTKLL